MDLWFRTCPPGLTQQTQLSVFTVFYGFIWVNDRQVLMAVRRKATDKNGPLQAMTKSNLGNLHNRDARAHGFIQSKKNGRFPRDDQEIEKIAREEWEYLVDVKQARVGEQRATA